MNVYHSLRRRAGHIAAGSALYDWSLRANAPDRLVVRPIDAWPGDVEAARAFGIPSWAPDEAPESWWMHTHGFIWLRDFRMLANERTSRASTREKARAFILSWISHYPKWEARSWRPDITGERVAMWLCTSDLIGEDFGVQGEDYFIFQEVFFHSLDKQARHLSRCLTRGLESEVSSVGAFRAARGLLYAGLAFEGREAWIEQALSFMLGEIDKQILGDGAHRSRSAKALVAVLQIFLDVRMTLASAGYPLPEKIQHAIDKMGPALRFFRYTDKRLALFNSTQEGDVDLLDSILGQAGVRAKTMGSLPCAGFERLSQGRTSILMDCGPVPSYPYDLEAHAGPLSFEMTYGRERMIVNCGSHPSCPEWQGALRSSAAHSTVTLAERNASEIRKDGHFSRKARRPSHLREDTREAALIEASHDGYESLNGFVHQRRLYLCDDGNDLRGEDTLSAALAPFKPVTFAVRFHLHPKTMVSLIRDGQEALIRLASGIGWRFHQAGGSLILEDSIYVGQGSQARKTKQLAIYGQITDKKHKIRWALQKEG